MLLLTFPYNFVGVSIIPVLLYSCESLLPISPYYRRYITLKSHIPILFPSTLPDTDGIDEYRKAGPTVLREAFMKSVGDKTWKDKFCNWDKRTEGLLQFAQSTEGHEHNFSYMVW